MGSCTFTNNLLIGNTAYYKGAGFENTGTSTYSSTLILINNTITQNSCTEGGSLGGGLLVNTVEDTVIGMNNIVYDNHSTTAPNISGAALFTYSCVEGGWPGTGNIGADPLFVTGPGGACYLSQTAAGQSQNSPCLDAGDPASTMIIGTTRTDQVQDAGIVDMGYHYAIAIAPPPPVTITLEPELFPPIIPPIGGSFYFWVTLANTGTSPQTFDVWIMVQLPNQSWYGPLLGPLSLTLPGGGNILRLRSQVVPGTAPAGNYWYEGRIGDYPSAIWDTSGFAFTKSATGDGYAVSGWLCSGDLFPGEELTQNDEFHNSSFIIHNYSPNPFNPTTVARYELPDASHVRLQVYDTAGRLVATLVDGWRAAGSHEVTFDGSSLAAGIYLARLEAGEYVGVEKLVLLK